MGATGIRQSDGEADARAMAAGVMANPASPVDGNLPTQVVDDEDETRGPAIVYQPISILSVISLVLGAAGILSMFSWYFGLVPLAGIVLGVLGLREVKRAAGVMAGLWIARGGIALSMVTWGVGAWFMAFYSAEVPNGYVRVDFEQLQPDPENPNELVPPLATELNDQFVYIKGYMYPGRQVTGLKEFIMVPTAGHCNFCTRQILPTEMVYARMSSDLVADYTSDRVGIGGRLKVNPTNELGKPTYEIAVDYLR